MLEEQVFNPKLHDRAGFRCGEPALDDFLRRYASQQTDRGLCTVFVLVDGRHASSILGYYTLSAAQIDVQQLSELERRKLPRYPVPCFRMGRLARHVQAQGKGIGSMLVGLAVDRCIKAKAQVAAYALLVDAKNDKSRSFYEHFGFIACAESPASMYLPLGA